MMGSITKGFVLLLSVALGVPTLPSAIAGGIGCRWQGVPPITLMLPGKTDAKKSLSTRIDALTIGINDVERYHGRPIGPGVALGYRACQIALSRLYPGEIPLRGDQFVVSGSAKDCPGDAVSYVTGARYGKGSEGAFNGNLVFDKSVRRFSFIFASMSRGNAVKLTSKFVFPQEFVEAAAKSKEGAEAEEKFLALARRVSAEVLTAPEAELFEVTPLEDFRWQKCKEKHMP